MWAGGELPHKTSVLVLVPGHLNQESFLLAIIWGRVEEGTKRKEKEMEVKRKAKK